jgi:hypothetical protein
MLGSRTRFKKEIDLAAHRGQVMGLAKPVPMMQTVGAQWWFSNGAKLCMCAYMPVHVVRLPPMDHRIV